MHPIAHILKLGVDINFYIEAESGYVIGKEFVLLCEPCKEINKPDDEIDDFLADCDCDCEIYSPDLLFMQNYEEYPNLVAQAQESPWETTYDNVALNGFQEQHETNANKINIFKETRQKNETAKGVPELANAVAYQAIRRQYRMGESTFNLNLKPAQAPGKPSHYTDIDDKDLEEDTCTAQGDKMRDISYTYPKDTGKALFSYGPARKIKDGGMAECPFKDCFLYVCPGPNDTHHHGSWSKDKKVFHPEYITEKEKKYNETVNHIPISALIGKHYPDPEPEPYPYKYKIYVAGSWKDRDQIRLEWMDKLEQLGHTITHDWTKSEQERGGCRDIPYHEKCSGEDIQGVVDCKILLVVMDSTNPEYQYRGTFTELGAALALNKVLPVHQQKTIILYNPLNYLEDIDKMVKHTRGVSNVFYWDKDINRVSTPEEAIEIIESSTI